MRQALPVFSPKRCLLAVAVLVACCNNGVGQASGPARTLDRADFFFRRMEPRSVQALLDSLAPVVGDDSNMVAVSAAIGSRLLRSQGKIAEAYGRIGVFARQRTKSLEPVVEIAVLKELAQVLKAMQLMDKAEEAAVRAYHFAQAMRVPVQEVDLLVLMAEIDRKQARWEKALERLIAAEAMADSIGHPRARCNVSINRGNIFLDQDRHAEAYSAYQSALRCAQEHGFLDIAGNAVLNIGAAMYYLHTPAKVLAFYDSVLTHGRFESNATLEADIRTNIAAACNQAGNHARAYREIQRAMRMYIDLNDTTNTAYCYQYLSGTFMSMNKLDSALEATTRWSEMSRATGNKELEADAELRFAEIKDLIGDCRGALGHLERGHALRIQQIKDKNSQRMGFLEVQFDTEKKEQDLALSRSQLQATAAAERAKHAQRNWLIVLAFLLTGLAALLFWNYRGQRRLRAQEQTLHTREVSDLLKQQEINSLESMMKGQERERERVGRDLHDRIGSMLSSVKLQFSALEGRIVKLEDTQRTQYEKVTGLLDEAVAEVRRISHDMVRGTLAEFGLLRALKDLGEALNAPGRLKVEMSAFGMDTRLPQPFEIGVYRMVQECVSNVLRHAKASELTIQVTRSGSALNVLVEDNGRGFDAAANEGGLGLRNIKERAAALGGSVNVDSVIGRGTTVSIDLPLS